MRESSGIMRRLAALVVVSSSVTAGCAARQATIPAVPEVDLARFMGDWYVIAHVPSRPERDAWNAIESYSLRPDGRIDTVFRYRPGGFDAPLRTMRPVGTVVPETGNAVWGMQFVWPVQAEYVIVYVDPDYTRTIVARSKRDYAWIMARTPSIPEPEYLRLREKLGDLGYSLDDLRLVPQQWPEASDQGEPRT